ncbi:hypothetical protein Leryth_022695 [Lithospermum erythrorhizon]|nr:hypothetical protein Leryth_022695 [Lithospermum erythrorhizon]
MSPTPQSAKPMKLNYAKLIFQNFVNYFPTYFLVSFLVILTINLSNKTINDFMTIWNSLNVTSIQIISSSFLIISLVAYFCISKPRKVYLVDYACFKPPNNYRVPSAKFMEHARLSLPSHPKSVNFQVKILERSGLGEETCLPLASHFIPPSPTFPLAMGETELILFSAMDSLLEKTCIKPKDIDILIVNCSLFSPIPSLSSIVINKYKLRSNVRSFNLSGMGCSAGLISINLATSLLQVHKNSNAVVISTEIITPNSYLGKERSMLLPNCLFRMGGGAVLLSNKKSNEKISKYSFLRVVRTHKGYDHKSYKCVYEEEDPEGIIGIGLSVNLMEIAGEALKTNITSLGPLVLPASEQLLFLSSLIGRKVLRLKWRPYIPDFKLAFEHFCIHAGGRAVIDEVQKSLKLSNDHIEPSRMTLHRFGNTSSSSLWYELGYIEAKGRMKKGDRVWQIGFGSGFKCNSAVWRCNRTIKKEESRTDDAPWGECIDRYPVHIQEVLKL